MAKRKLEVNRLSYENDSEIYKANVAYVTKNS